MSVAIRPATMDDADLLLPWANDPDTRAASFRPETIDPATHVRWLRERLAVATARQLIGSIDGTPAGVVRSDALEDGVAEVGIVVAPEWRGRGIGRELLLAAIRVMATDASFGSRTLVARIRPENAASVALFRGAGFHEVEPGECAGIPCRRFERSMAPDQPSRGRSRSCQVTWSKPSSGARKPSSTTRSSGNSSR